MGQAILTIDLGALAENWRRARRTRAKGAECAARGQGRRLWPRDRAGRAGAARRGLQDVFRRPPVGRRDLAQADSDAASQARIFILNGLAPSASQFYAQAQLIPVLGSLPEMARMGRFLQPPTARAIPPRSHIDTGMNRLGLAARPAPRPQPDGRLHAGPGDEPFRLRRRHFGAAQSQADRALRACLRAIAAHAGLDVQQFGHVPRGRAFPRSGAVRATRFTAAIRRRAATIRCAASSALQRWCCRSATFRAAKPPATTPAGRRRRGRKLATINLGYADGFLRSGSCRTGRRGDFCRRPFLPGGRAHLDGPVDHRHHRRRPPQPRRPDRNSRRQTISVDELATQAGTIGYEILTALGGASNVFMSAADACLEQPSPMNPHPRADPCVTAWPRSAPLVRRCWRWPAPPRAEEPSAATSSNGRSRAIRRRSLRAGKAAVADGGALRAGTATRVSSCAGRKSPFSADAGTRARPRDLRGRADPRPRRRRASTRSACRRAPGSTLSRTARRCIPSPSAAPKTARIFANRSNSSFLRRPP